MKLILAIAALAAVSAKDSLPARTEAGIAPEIMPEVVQVRCLSSAGSAFYVGPRTLLTVAHVTSASECRIKQNGQDKPFAVVGQKDDFAILRVAEPASRWLHVDCGGFVKGRTYTAWGFARGLPTLTSVDSEANGDRVGAFARLWGVFHVIPGQSGGPFIDSLTRKAVGMVNVYDHRRGDSGSVELRGTSICRA